MLPRSRTSQSKQPRDHTARAHGGVGVVYASGRRRARPHARTRRKTGGHDTEGWTGGRAEAGTHAHAHAHAYRRARRGSTLRRRRARVRGTAVCRRTGYLGPRRPR
eukprot:scaffold47912_cov73-Phaeocystis_antarctica.AAC.3